MTIQGDTQGTGVRKLKILTDQGADMRKASKRTQMGNLASEMYTAPKMITRQKIHVDV